MQRHAAACPLESPCVQAWQSCRRCRLCCALQLHWSPSRLLGLSPGSPPCLGQLQDDLKGLHKEVKKDILVLQHPTPRCLAMISSHREVHAFYRLNSSQLYPCKHHTQGVPWHAVMTSAMVGSLTSRAVVWGSRGGPGCGGPGRQGHELHASHGRRQRAMHGSVSQSGRRAQACARIQSCRGVHCAALQPGDANSKMRMCR